MEERAIKGGIGGRRGGGVREEENEEEEGEGKEEKNDFAPKYSMLG